VITICPELREHVLKSGYARPLALIENTLDFDVPPFDEEDVSALRQRLQVGDARVVLYTGTLEAYQGLDLLIQAARQVVKKERRVRFVIVGGKPEQIEQLRRQAQTADVEPHFVFVPAVPPVQVFLYHRIADVLVTTRARGTNTPLKVYQYLRADRPIVATAIGSHTQVLSEIDAELVQPTPMDIARGLLRVLLDPAHARTLAEAAGKLARERYSEQVYLDRLSGLLTEIMNDRRQRRAVA
jgi:glycosyltransferase involved in cell wall biosynthesis